MYIFFVATRPIRIRETSKVQSQGWKIVRARTKFPKYHRIEIFKSSENGLRNTARPVSHCQPLSSIHPSIHIHHRYQTNVKKRYGKSPTNRSNRTYFASRAGKKHQENQASYTHTHTLYICIRCPIAWQVSWQRGKSPANEGAKNSLLGGGRPFSKVRRVV